MPGLGGALAACLERVSGKPNRSRRRSAKLSFSTKAKTLELVCLRNKAFPVYLKLPGVTARCQTVIPVMVLLVEQCGFAVVSDKR